MRAFELQDDVAACERKLADYLARRDHSERELRTKLGRRFVAKNIDVVLAKAQARGWLASPEKLSRLTAERLAKRGKGPRYVQNYLRQKGLPAVKVAIEDELILARELVERKWKWPRPWDRAQQAKIGRFLFARGFRESVIRSVLYNKESD